MSDKLLNEEVFRFMEILAIGLFAFFFIVATGGAIIFSIYPELAELPRPANH